MGPRRPTGPRGLRRLGVELAEPAEGAESVGVVEETKGAEGGGMGWRKNFEEGGGRLGFGREPGGLGGLRGLRRQGPGSLSRCGTCSQKGHHQGQACPICS